MKRSPIMRIATIAMAVCLIMSCAVFGSVAKYTSSTTGSDNVQVAKWSFKVEDVDIASTEVGELNFNLFTTANFDEEGDDVVAGKIAPGTAGSFELNIENTSEVSAKYSVDLTCTNEGNVPLQFKVGEDGEWKSNIDDLEALLTAELEHGAAAVSHTIYWQWEFAGEHTAIGIAAPSVTVGATVSAEQVD